MQLGQLSWVILNDLCDYIFCYSFSVKLLRLITINHITPLAVFLQTRHNSFWMFFADIFSRIVFPFNVQDWGQSSFTIYIVASPLRLLSYGIYDHIFTNRFTCLQRRQKAFKDIANQIIYLRAPSNFSWMICVTTISPISNLFNVEYWGPSR